MWLGLKKVLVAFVVMVSLAGAALLVVSVIGDVVGFLNVAKLTGASVLVCVYKGGAEWLRRQAP